MFFQDIIMMRIEVYKGEITNKMVEEAAKVANRGFLRTKKDKMSKKEVREHMQGDTLYLVKQEDEIKGFASFKNLGDLLYLEGIVIDPCMQGRNCFYTIVEKEFEKNNAKYFSLRTQNPVMFSAANRLVDKGYLKKVYFDLNNCSEKSKNKLLEIQDYLKMKCIGFVNKGTYKKSLYGSGEYEYNHHTINEIINDMFEEEHFDSQKGDSVMFLSKLKNNKKTKHYNLE